MRSRFVTRSFELNGIEKLWSLDWFGNLWVRVLSISNISGLVGCTMFEDPCSSVFTVIRLGYLVISVNGFTLWSHRI